MARVQCWGVVLAVVGTLGGSAVGAVTVDVTVSGYCDGANCGKLGLTPGTPFSGRVGVEAGAFVPDSVASGAISSYDFAIGTFAMSEADEAISNNLVEWGDNPAEINAVYIFAFASVDPATPAPYLSLSASASGAGTGYAANDAYFFVAPDGSWAGSEGSGAFLVANPIQSAPAPIPLPAAGSMLAAALFSLWQLRTRSAAWLSGGSARLT